MSAALRLLSRTRIPFRGIYLPASFPLAKLPLGIWRRRPNGTVLMATKTRNPRTHANRALNSDSVCPVISRSPVEWSVMENEGGEQTNDNRREAQRYRIRTSEGHSQTEFLALKHESRILGHPSNPVCGFFVMEQVYLCAVWFMDNWLGSSLNHIQGWTTVRDSYSRALQVGPLLPKEKGVGEISGAGTFSGLPPVGVKSLRENSFCSCQVARPSRALAPSSLSLPFVLVLSSHHL